MVPEEDVQAVGTADPLGDAAEQRRLGPAGARLPDSPRVSGELLTFDDPQERLPALDRLEGFDPSGPSPYRRVLIPAETSGGAGVLAWAYISEGPSGIYLPGGRWPE